MPIACLKCGECCRTLQEVLITKQEYKLLRKHGKVKVKPAKGGKLKMKLPCPFQVDNLCTVHDIRPCQCRLWHCGRIKPEDKRIETIGGLQALMKANPEYKEFKTNMEDEAVAWGNAHGWEWRK